LMGGPIPTGSCRCHNSNEGFVFSNFSVTLANLSPFLKPNNLRVILYSCYLLETESFPTIDQINYISDFFHKYHLDDISA
jgi:hypothetical protein